MHYESLAKLHQEGLVEPETSAVPPDTARSQTTFSVETDIWTKPLSFIGDCRVQVARISGRLERCSGKAQT